MDRQFGSKKKPAAVSVMPGNVQSVEEIENGLRVRAEQASLQVRFLAANMVEVRVRPDHEFPAYHSYALDETFKPDMLPVSVQQDAQAIVAGVGDVVCAIWQENSQLQFTLGNGQKVSQNSGLGLVWRGEEISWTRQLPQEEWCYGFGLRAPAGLSLRGRQLALWNTDFIYYKQDSDPLYLSIPFYLGVHPQYAIGILWDNPARGQVDLGATQPNSMTLSAETGELRFFIIAAEKAEDVLKRYLELTGKPAQLPLWAFGYHQSRYTYTPSERVRDIAREFRRRKIPCDTLHFDIEYMHGYRVFTFDPETFGDIQALFGELGEQGFKTVGILDPAVKVDEQYEAFQSGKDQGVFHTYPDGTLYRAPVWAGESAFPDFTNPQTRQWWADQVSRLVKEGFDGLWNDMNEPTIFAPRPQVVDTLPDYLPANWEGQDGTHLGGAHNVYGMQMARATREGLTRAKPDKRPFVLTRAAYAGAQRYTGTWTGDNSSNWEHLRLTIPTVLNLGLSGMFYNGPDIGGFHDVGNPELYARWIQLGSVLPFCRTHTEKDTPDQEPWSYGTEVENIARHYLELRYQLLPYIYSTYVQSTATGVPPVRPTFLIDPSDMRLYEQSDAFMLGDILLFAPVLEEGATSREVYLPRGVWYDFWSRKLIDGARVVTVEAPLDQMPIFARAGKVLPMYPVMQYVGEKSVEELHLLAFAGSGETTIYEDAGEGFDYQQGDYRWSYFSNQYLPNGQFGVDWRRAGRYQPGYSKARLEIIGISGEPEAVTVDDQPAALWFFENGVVEILNAPFEKVRIIGKTRDDAAAETIVSRSPLDLE
jgi:alpha-glucosidase